MKALVLRLASSSLFCAMVAAQTAQQSVSAQAAIDAGNRAWIDGVKNGDVALISATYAVDAVDCNSAGECIRGRSDIERHIKAQLASMGRARSAGVKSVGSTQQGNFVYEWGEAKATFAGGRELIDRYLTAWQKQPDGTWKIFRNMVIPQK